MALLLVMTLMHSTRLEAATEAGNILLAAATDASRGGATEQEWSSVVREHKASLLVAGGVLAGIMVFSAVILVLVVRRARRLHGTPSADALRRGPAYSPSMREAKVLGAVRGSKAFPTRTAAAKQARSGDTTPLTLEEELAAVKDEEPESPMPPPRIPFGAGVWAIAIAWVCLFAGIVVMVQSPGSLVQCAPLFLITVLLAVTAMTQRQVLHGSLVLAALYLAVPTVWLTQYLESEEEANKRRRDRLAETHGANASSGQNDPTSEARNLLAQQEALLKGPPRPPIVILPPKNPAPPSVWKQILPEHKAKATPPVSPPEAGTTPPPSMRVPDLPPPPTKAGGALFSYRARLSRADHLDQNGSDLRNAPQTTFGDILFQERLHVHQGGKRDPEDTVDDEFALRPLPAYRALFAKKEIRLPKNLLLFQLLKDDVIVDVQVFLDFLEVNLVSAQE